MTSVVQHAPATGINPVFLAQSRLRRRRFDDSIEVCTDILQKNALDQQSWFIKVRATTLKNWVDDTELEEEGAKIPKYPEDSQLRYRVQDEIPLSAVQGLVTSCWKTMLCKLRPGQAHP
jgi:hypothetical protein